MAVRIRKNGRIFCAAMYPKEEGDIYIDDTLHYHLGVEAKVLVTDDKHLRDDGRTGHGEWWWNNQVPNEVTIQDFYKKPPIKRR